MQLDLWCAHASLGFDSNLNSTSLAIGHGDEALHLIGNQPIFIREVPAEAVARQPGPGPASLPKNTNKENKRTGGGGGNETFWLPLVTLLGEPP